MAETEKEQKGRAPGGEADPRPKRRLPEPTPNFRKALIVWLLMTALALLMVQLYRDRMEPIQEIPYNPNFRQLVVDGRIKTCEILEENTGNTFVRGVVLPPPDAAAGKDKQPKPFKTYVRRDDQELQQFLVTHGVGIKYPAPSNPYLVPILTSVLPVLIVFGLLYFLFVRQVRSAGAGALNFGKSRARLLAQDRRRATFADVAGIDEAKEEVQEIIDFLKAPKKFQQLGGRIPKGVLLMGPPGTGKTLLAKAIAGEAEVPFFSISGSDFVEMFVGVGASRVRDMFEQGKKNAPCLIFIDEIDAVGRSRFTGIGGGHDEREQTLNALLVEMDGFDTQEGVIIIAATNRPDVLDQALLRPGRFDRQIVIDLPNLDGREAILRMHAKKIKLAPEADLRRMARGTPGFSGADLANLLNEAALLAARGGKPAVVDADLDEARDKVKWGRERRSRGLDEKEKRITAYHESGHAIATILTEGSEPLHKITIIPRGVAYLGATMQLPVKDRYMETRERLLGTLTTLMGGRVAESLVFGDITWGARSDLKEATRLARHMVCDWGMSEAMGPQTFGEHEELMFLGRDIARKQDYSEATAQRIDAEVSRLLNDAYQRAVVLLTENRDKLDLLAKLLLERETLDGRDAEDLIKHGRIRTEAERPAAVPPPPPPTQGEANAPVAVS
jgi:cell division protease FtsH